VGLVGSCSTPRQILVALRLLKAVTVAFIALAAVANVVYVSCVEFVADDYSTPYFGHRRDTLLRLYGLAAGVLALLIELDSGNYSGGTGVPTSAVVFQMVSACVL